MKTCLDLNIDNKSRDQASNTIYVHTILATTINGSMPVLSFE